MANAINTTVWNAAIATGGIAGGVSLEAGGPAILPLATILFAGVALAVAIRSHAYAFGRGPRVRLKPIRNPVT